MAKLRRNDDPRCTKPNGCPAKLMSVCRTCLRRTVAKIRQHQAKNYRLREKGLIADIVIEHRPVGLFSAPIRTMPPQEAALIAAFLATKPRGTVDKNGDKR